MNSHCKEKRKKRKKREERRKKKKEKRKKKKRKKKKKKTTQTFFPSCFSFEATTFQAFGTFAFHRSRSSLLPKELTSSRQDKRCPETMGPKLSSIVSLLVYDVFTSEVPSSGETGIWRRRDFFLPSDNPFLSTLRNILSVHGHVTWPPRISLNKDGAEKGTHKCNCDCRYCFISNENAVTAAADILHRGHIQQDIAHVSPSPFPSRGKKMKSFLGGFERGNASSFSQRRFETNIAHTGDALSKEFM